MNKQSLFFTVLVAVVATVLLLMTLQFIVKKRNIKPAEDGKLNTSYTIWFASILISFFLLLKPALEQIENAIEVIIFSKTIDDTFIQVMQRIAINIGFTYFFTFLAYYTIHNVLKFTFGKRNDSIEIEKNNKEYFMIKGILLILFVFSLITIFQHFLQWFAPTVDTIFYH
jgi:uncharacterized membrane protein